MPAVKITAVCQNYLGDTNRMCDQNAEFLEADAGGMYSNHSALKG